MIGFVMDYKTHSRTGLMVRFDAEGERGYKDAFIWLSREHWERLGQPPSIAIEVRTEGEE